VLGGVISNLEVGWKFRVLIMFSHGFCSSGLFVLANVCYEKINSRNMHCMGGLIMFSPTITIFFFVFRVVNFGGGPTLNIVSEFFLVVGVLTKWPIMCFFICVILFINMAYRINMYVKVNFGYSEFIQRLIKEFVNFYTLFIHLWPLFIFLWFPHLLVNLVF
jgi:NADH:ubiquinone oxidoreductase subunit 4 (subunit M)